MEPGEVEPRQPSSSRTPRVRIPSGNPRRPEARRVPDDSAAAVAIVGFGVPILYGVILGLVALASSPASQPGCAALACSDRDTVGWIAVLFTVPVILVSYTVAAIVVALTPRGHRRAASAAVLALETLALGVAAAAFLER